MTNQEILKVYKGLTGLVEAKIKLGIKTSYVLACDKMLLENYVRVIETQQRELYLKYGTVEDDGSLKVPLEKFEQLNKDLDELMAIKNDVILKKISIDELGDAEIEVGIIENLIAVIEETQE